MPEQATSTTSNSQNGNSAQRATVAFIAGLFSFAVRACLIAFFVLAGLFIGGFLNFTNTVTNATLPEKHEVADGIVVLTGGSSRIAHALKLLEEEMGQRLLISGVNKDTATADISKLNSSHSRMFACCVDIERRALDTIGNAREAKKWSQEKDYKSLIVVTSAYHLPRALNEFRRAMQDYKLIGYSVPVAALQEKGWWLNPDHVRLILSEYIKYLVALSRDYLSEAAFNSLRRSIQGV